MKTQQQADLLQEINELKQRIQIVERKAIALPKSRISPPKRTFQKAYPDIHIDPRLFKFVGIDPPLSLGREKEAIGEALRNRLAAK